MKKKEVFKSLKDLSSFLLCNERINSQRCVAQDIDTTKTIIEIKEDEHNDEHNEHKEHKEHKHHKYHKEDK